MAGGVQPIDIWGAFQASYDAAQRAKQVDAEQDRQKRQDAIQSETMQWQREDRRHMLDIQLKAAQTAATLQAAREKAATGNYAPLAQIDPEGAAKLQHDVSANQNDAADRATKDATEKATTTARVKEFALQSLQANPAAAPQIRAMVQQQVQAGKIEPFELPEGAPSGGQLDQIRLATGFDLARTGAKPQAEPELAQMFSLTHPEIKPWMPGYGPALERFMLEQKKAGASQVNVNNGELGLSKETQAKVEGDVYDATKLERMINEVEKNIAAAGGSKALGGAFRNNVMIPIEQGMSALGLTSPSTDEELTAREKAASSLNTLNLKFEHELVSRLSPESQKLFRNSSPSMDNNPELRDARLASMRQMINSGREEGVYALTKGIDVGKKAAPPSQPHRREPAPTTAAPTQSGAIRRTDPATGETRVWNGAAWVKG